MKRFIWLWVSCVLVICILPACDVISALEITPYPMLSLAPTPSPEQVLQPTPKPDEHSLPNDTVIKFVDPAVEKMIRNLLVLPESDITTAEMRKIISFDYNHDIYPFANETIHSLEDLRYCVNLEYLYISGNLVSDLSPLAGMKSLQSIWVDGNPIEDASAALALPSLQEFSALHTGITDISALSFTQNLRIFCCDSDIEVITPLFGHKNLSQVSLTGINDQSFRALLTNCKELSRIRIKNSDLNDGSLALFQGRSLYALELDNCGIHDISALAGAVAVDELRFPNNSIEDISILRKVQLSYLDLSHNQIRDWGPLRTDLMELLVTGNPITQSDKLDYLEKGGCKITR